mgnify:FL=1
MSKNNVGFNQWYRRSPQWPPHELKMYNQIGAQNQRREGRLTPEQAEKYANMRALWLERGAYYSRTTNHPDDLCWVMACRDVLNTVTAKQEPTDE